MISALEKRLQTVENHVKKIQLWMTAEDYLWKKHVEKLVLQYFGQDMQQELKSASNRRDLNTASRNESGLSLEQDRRALNYNSELSSPCDNSNPRKRRRVSFGPLIDSFCDANSLIDLTSPNRSSNLLVDYENSDNTSPQSIYYNCEELFRTEEDNSISMCPNELGFFRRTRQEEIVQQGPSTSASHLPEMTNVLGNLSVRERERGKMVSKRLNFESESHSTGTQRKDKQNQISNKISVLSFDRQAFASPQIERNMISPSPRTFFEVDKAVESPANSSTDSQVVNKDKDLYFTPLLKNPKFQSTPMVNVEPQISSSNSNVPNDVEVTSSKPSTSSHSSTFSSPSKTTSNVDVPPPPLNDGKAKTSRALRKLERVKAHQAKMLELHGVRSLKAAAPTNSKATDKNNEGSTPTVLSSNSVSSTNSEETESANQMSKNSDNIEMSKTKSKHLQKSVACKANLKKKSKEKD